MTSTPLTGLTWRDIDPAEDRAAEALGAKTVLLARSLSGTRIVRAIVDGRWADEAQWKTIVAAIADIIPTEPAFSPPIERGATEPRCPCPACLGCCCTVVEGLDPDECVNGPACCCPRAASRICACGKPSTHPSGWCGEGHVEPGPPLCGVDQSPIGHAWLIAQKPVILQSPGASDLEQHDLTRCFVEQRSRDAVINLLEQGIGKFARALAPRFAAERRRGPRSRGFHFLNLDPIDVPLGTVTGSATVVSGHMPIAVLDVPTRRFRRLRGARRARALARRIARWERWVSAHPRLAGKCTPPSGVTATRKLSKPLGDWTKFPGGDHDDIVDAVASFWKQVGTPPKTECEFRLPPRTMAFRSGARIDFVGPLEPFVGGSSSSIGVVDPFPKPVLRCIDLASGPLTRILAKFPVLCPACGELGSRPRAEESTPAGWVVNDAGRAFCTEACRDAAAKGGDA